MCAVAAGRGLVVEAFAGLAVAVEGAAAPRITGPAPPAVVFKFLHDANNFLKNFIIINVYHLRCYNYDNHR